MFIANSEFSPYEYNNGGGEDSKGNHQLASATSNLSAPRAAIGYTLLQYYTVYLYHKLKVVTKSHGERCKLWNSNLATASVHSINMGRSELGLFEGIR